MAENPISYLDATPFDPNKRLGTNINLPKLDNTLLTAPPNTGFDPSIPDDSPTREDVASLGLDKTTLLYGLQNTREDLILLRQDIANLGRQQLPEFLKSISDLLLATMKEQNIEMPKGDIINFLYSHVLMDEFSKGIQSLSDYQISLHDMEVSANPANQTRQQFSEIHTNHGTIALRSDILRERFGDFMKQSQKTTG